MLIDDLRPSALSESTLTVRIGETVESFMAETGIAVTVKMNADEMLGIGRATEITAYRVVQESLNNIRRHSRASHVVIDLHSDGSTLSGSVSDNGTGLCAVAHLAHEQRSGMGMVGMRERVEFLSGTFDVISDEHCGTTVEFTIPLGRGTLS